MSNYWPINQTVLRANPPSPVVSHKRTRFVAIGVCVVGLSAWVAGILLSSQHATPWRTTIGGDFPAFFIAGKIVGQSPDRLYDFGLQAHYYHALAPRDDTAVTLPYVYPPIIAIVFRPLSLLPYTTAVVVWGLLSLALYTGGILLLLLACPSIPKSARLTAVLLSLAFEPFIIECLNGGQISVLGFFAICCGILLLQRGRLFWAGVALGVLAYKPTLLVILLPCLFIKAYWRTLAGMSVTIFTGFLLGLIFAGRYATSQFVQRMHGYLHAAAAGDGFRTWKFVDLSACLKLLLHRPDFTAWPVCLIGAAIVLWFIYRQNRISWPAILLGTLVFNVYVGIYDTILAIPAAWLIVDAGYASPWAAVGGLPRRTQWWLVLLFVAPWITQESARIAGLQLDTFILAAGLLLFCNADLT